MELMEQWWNVLRPLYLKTEDKPQAPHIDKRYDSLFVQLDAPHLGQWSLSPQELDAVRQRQVTSSEVNRAFFLEAMDLDLRCYDPIVEEAIELGANLSTRVVPLKRLKIGIYLEEFHPEFDIEICEVLRVCPAAEFIELFGLHVTDFAKLSEFMETHECQLSVLEFGKRRLDDDQATIFFDALKDPGSRMTQQIRELCVEFEKEVVSADTLVAIQEMLEINRTLEVFVLAVPIRCKDVAEKTLSLVPPVYLPRVRAPLPLRSKLAFISMTYASTKATSQLACLDSEVISIIFGFAVKHHNSELSLTSPQERFVDVAISAE
ncbi:hypothetical protein Poli38472_011206 [Pythium oligandrum]|uniref:Uncharacterized protein n=1 Tax=Pythium oligandrum TaxID=41045 RepID=A0A8K1CRZ8_PYTOL|nr:hypothetical protein Poli38472_011206 [Pythium oligandrum]|eukprot:TMW67586.1 hypothetical protein Poli38472_011206 [Pythium oligandrum]